LVLLGSCLQKRGTIPVAFSERFRPIRCLGARGDGMKGVSE
jgi:hypothetical protein